MAALQKSLSIALLIDDFYPASGGISRSVQTQINELVGLGHQVTLIAPKHHLEAPKDCKTLTVGSFYIPGAPPYTCIIRHDKRFARKLSADHAFDVVHSQTERGALILAAKIAKLQQIPHIHTFHTNLAGTHETNPLASFWGSMAYLLLVNTSIALASPKRIDSDVIIPPTHADARSFTARFDWHSLATIASRVDGYTAPAKFMVKRINQCSVDLAKRGEVIPTGVNRTLSDAIKKQEKVSKKPETVKFLSLSRLSKEKRVDVIVEAFIKAGIDNSQLDIVGTGDQLGQLKRLAKGHSNIIFHEQVKDINRVAKFYTNANVFVLASHKFDTQAITIAEAVTAGLPVVYCDSRLDIGVSRANSILTKGPDVASISQAMKKVADKQTRQRLAKASRAIAPSLTPEQMADQYTGLYKKLIKKP